MLLITVIELIPIPFELLIDTTLWVIESNPFIGAITLTSAIPWLGTIASNEVSSTTSPVSGFIIIKSGAFK